VLETERTYRMTDPKRLRELAMAAEKRELGSVITIQIESQIPSESSTDDHKNFLDYYSAANPTVILALLDRLERYEGALREVQIPGDLDIESFPHPVQFAVRIARKALANE